MPSRAPEFEELGPVIFDLDGTLVDSEPLHLVATNRVLAGFGAGLTTEDNHQYLGLSDAEYWALLRERFRIASPIEALGAARVAAFETLISPGKPAVTPGIFEFISTLRNADVPVGVASSSPRRIVDRTLEVTGLQPFVQAVAGGDEVPRAKPDPAVYRLARERLGEAEPRRSVPLAFEDSPRGILAARAAGFAVVGVRGRTGPEQDMSGVIASVADFRGLTVARLLEWASGQGIRRGERAR